MSYPARIHRSHQYSTYFAPRGNARMADLGMLIAQQFLSPFDKLIGLLGVAGSGKSLLIRGMFPGLDLTNDDEGVNVRPLPILSVDDQSGFYTPNTYHLDIRFEMAFTQLHELAEAILKAINKGKRVIVEHFDLIYPLLNQNANLLVGVGQEVIITRPTLFGPKPKEITDIVFNSVYARLRAHSAEDVCEKYLEKQGISKHLYEHADVHHGFILSFFQEPDIDITELEHSACRLIEEDVPISYVDENKISIGNELHKCTGPRMHVRSTGEIKKLTLLKELLHDPITGRYLLVGIVGDNVRNIEDLSELNRITLR